MSRAAVLAATLLLGSFLWAAQALGAPRDPAQEAAIDQAVSTVDPALVALVHQGNDAMDRNDPAAAVEAYGAVHAKVPNMVDITRRLGIAVARAGDVQQGEALCRLAVKADGTAENHAALAQVLLFHDPVSPAASSEALSEARLAARLAPKAEYAQLVLCEAGSASHDRAALIDCSEALASIAPQAPETHHYRAVAKLASEDYDGAEKEIDAAAAAGLPEATVAALRQQLEMAHPHVPLRVRVTQAVAAGFVFTLFVLVVLGLLLADTATRSSAAVARRVYGTWLVLAGRFFYVYVALLTAVLLFVLVAGVYLFVVIASPPLYARIAGAVVGAYVLLVLVRASLASTSDGSEGIRVNLRRNGRLKEVLDAVAHELGQAPITAVRVTSSASFDVAARDSSLELRVGAFALEGLPRRAFQALLARELGRFTGPCAKALEVRSRFDALAQRMTERGVATAANPAWWLVGSYRWMYERLSDAAVDLQTRWADEQACRLFGSRALLEGLQHVVRRDVELQARCADIVREALDAEAPAQAVTSFGDAWSDYEEEAAHLAELDAKGRLESAAGDAWDLFDERSDIERATVGKLTEHTLEGLGLSAAEPAQ